MRCRRWRWPLWAMPCWSCSFAPVWWARPRLQPNRLHTVATHYVSAHAQNLELELIEPMLTDAEAAVLRRGKNASKATVAKHATVQEYRASTGFECLLGWLYLQGKNDRIEELFNALWDGYKPE